MTQKRIKDWYKLSGKQFWFLCIYFVSLFTVAIVITYQVLLYENLFSDISISEIGIWGGIGSALIGCTVFYLRKLYKAAINDRFKHPANRTESIRSYGVFLYYFLRPFFAVAFSFFIHISLKAGVSIITVEEPILDKGFIYLILFLSFFAGFGAGDMLTMLEKRTKNVISKFIEQ